MSRGEQLVGLALLAWAVFWLGFLAGGSWVALQLSRAHEPRPSPAVLEL